VSGAAEGLGGAPSLLGLLADLVRAASAVGSPSLRLAAELLAARAGQDDALRVVLLGQFNRGKSSLVNALLGQDLAPAGPRPTTRWASWFAPVPAGPWRQVTPTLGAVGLELVVSAAGEGPLDPSVAAPPSDSCSWLERGVGEEGTPGGVWLLDTPGLAEPQGHLLASEAWLRAADLVLVVLDAAQPLDAAEALVLERLQRRGGASRLWLVLARVDLLEPDELAGLQQDLLERLPPALAGRPLWLCSARRARRGGDPGVQALRAALAAQGQPGPARRLRGEALAQEARGIAAELVQAAALRAAAAELSPEDCRLRAERARRRWAEGGRGDADVALRLDLWVQERRAALERDWSDYLTRFAAALPQQVAAARPEDLREHFGAFLRDRLLRGARREAERSRAQAVALAEELSSLRGEALLTARLGGGEVAALCGLDLAVYSPVSDGGVLALGALGTGLLLLGALPLGGAVALAAAPAWAEVVQHLRGARLREKALEQGTVLLAQLGEQTRAALQGHLAETRRLLQELLVGAAAPLLPAVADALAAVASLAPAERAAALAAAAEARRVAAAALASLEVLAGV